MLADEVTLPTIQFVLEAMANGSFPTLETAHRFLDARTYVTFGTKVPHNATARRSVKVTGDEGVEVTNDNGEVTDIEQSQINNTNIFDEDEEDDGGSSKSIYELNNASTDVPMQQDLNCNSTLKSIVNYHGGLVERCLSNTLGCGMVDPQEDFMMNTDLEAVNPWAAAGWDEMHWPTPWMQKLGPILCGDGQPTFGLLNLKASDHEFRQKDFTPFNGGFHTMLELHKMR